MNLLTQFVNITTRISRILTKTIGLIFKFTFSIQGISKNLTNKRIY